MRQLYPLYCLCLAVAAELFGLVSGGSTAAAVRITHGTWSSPMAPTPGAAEPLFRGASGAVPAVRITHGTCGASGAVPAFWIFIATWVSLFFSQPFSSFSCAKNYQKFNFFETGLIYYNIDIYKTPLFGKSGGIFSFMDFKMNSRVSFASLLFFLFFFPAAYSRAVSAAAVLNRAALSDAEPGAPGARDYSGAAEAARVREADTDMELKNGRTEGKLSGLKSAKLVFCPAFKRLNGSLSPITEE